MIDFRLTFIISALLLASSSAWALPRGGTTSDCPTSRPSPAGATIYPNTGKQSCTVYDSGGKSFYYPPSGPMYENGSRTSFLGTLITIGSDGHAYFQKSCIAGTIWRDITTSFYGSQVVGVQKPFSNRFRIVRGGRSAATFLQIGGAAANARAGDTISGNANPTGLSVYDSSAQITVPSVTVNLASGTVLGCEQAGGASTIYSYSANGLTVNATGAMIGYVHDTGSGEYRCVDPTSDANVTLNGGTYRDCDFGFQSSGNNGTSHITNAIFDHNGSPVTSAATHDVYIGYASIGSDWIISGGGAFCVHTGRNISNAGYFYKIRDQQSTLSGLYAADPSTISGIPTSDCAEAGAIDFPCGGVQNVGQAGAGNGVTLEIGPNNPNNSGTGIIIWENEVAGSPATNADCPERAAQVTGEVSNGSGGHGNLLDISSTKEGSIQVGQALVLSSGNLVAMTASASGGVLTVTAIKGGTSRAIVPGQYITCCTGVTYLSLQIGSQISGTPGGAGTYNLSYSGTLGRQAMYIGMPSPTIVARQNSSTEYTISTSQYVPAGTAMGQIGWPTNHLTVQNALVIDDNTKPAITAFYNPYGPAASAMLKNTVTVCNGTGAPECNFAGMYPGATDGGGNTFYSDRTAASTALAWAATDPWGRACCAYPYIPLHP
jgi:hypothetical protein